MGLDLRRFYRACNPAKVLDLKNREDKEYYIDFGPVRGGQTIEEIERTISLLSADEPTCQLFSGHIGCGKSTELLRLRAELENKGFHVVYFESTQDLEMSDVDVSDIFLSIARQVSESIEKMDIALQPQGFKALLKGAKDLLNTRIDISAEANLPGIGTVSAGSEGKFSLSTGIAKITAQAKASPDVRSWLREYLEPRTKNIEEAINRELLEPTNRELQRRGKQGLVVIVDNLDRVDNRRLQTGRTLPEYLFVDRGEQLSKLNCHVVYTIPLALTFSNDYSSVIYRLGKGMGAKVLPMVPAQLSDGTDCNEGIELLGQMVLARAFPELGKNQRLDLITEVFDSQETLNRLCRVSGGHVRNLLGLLYRCLQKGDPPIDRQRLESVIRERCNELTRSIDPEEWELLRQVAQHKNVRGETEYQILLRSMYVFEYNNDQGRWYDVNPILAEAKEFQK